MKRKTRATESVWDYPRPPRVEPAARRIVVKHCGQTIADTTSALRVLETSHPPTYYIPQSDIRDGVLVANSRRTVCEFKGTAEYFDLKVGGTRVEAAAWTYPRPRPGFEKLAGYVAFYAQKADECYVDDERVDPQAGPFYGGWITSDITGPFKGGPGTAGW